MKQASKMLREGRKSELWEMYCGYIHLTLPEFMGIQKRLLMEQLTLLGSSQIGRSILGDQIPQTIDEFRQNVPLTTYADYEPFLVDKNEDVLPVKPYDWGRTSGRSSGGGPKWIPITKQFYDGLANSVIGAMMMSACSEPGDVKLQINDRILLATAPPPFISGYVSRATNDQLEVKFLPSLEEGEDMDFAERIATGFKLAMREGVDYFYGIASVLARVGAQFEESSDNSPKLTLEHLNPFVLWRLIKAVVKARFNNNKLLPKDIWKLKGVMCGGTDTEIYRKKIKYYWGLEPLEGYGSTESGTMCMQSWNLKGMTFFPDSCFLEFIPLEDLIEHEKNPDHPLKTVLFDELEVGIYELVFSNFHGGVFMRYRVGDLFEVVSIGDDEIRSTLPQVRYYSRDIDIIDLGSMVRFSEKNIWKSIEETGLNYFDWVARKEIAEGEPNLHIYIEINPGSPISESGVYELIDKHLSQQVPEFRDYKSMLKHNPLKVSLLTPGSFSAYMDAQQKAGADLGHYKPPHMQPKDHIMEKLLSVKSTNET
jgi:hypothetical protein